MGEWAELSFGPKRQPAGGGRGHPALRKEFIPEAFAHFILERDKRKFLEEPKPADRCCLGLNTCLPCVVTHTVGLQLTHTSP